MNNISLIMSQNFEPTAVLCFCIYCNIQVGKNKEVMQKGIFFQMWHH